MDRYDEMFDAIKKSLELQKKGIELQQLTARNQRWDYADDKDKANIIDKQISDILNPNKEESR